MDENKLRKWARRGLASMDKSQLVDLCMLLGGYKELHKWAEQGKKNLSRTCICGETISLDKYCCDQCEEWFWSGGGENEYCQG